jgi:hypothetical protein
MGHPLVPERDTRRSLSLLQLGVLGLRLLQDRAIGLGVFPECEEILAGGEGADAGGIGICPAGFLPAARLEERLSREPWLLYVR